MTNSNVSWLKVPIAMAVVLVLSFSLAPQAFAAGFGDEDWVPFGDTGSGWSPYGDTGSGWSPYGDTGSGWMPYGETGGGENFTPGYWEDEYFTPGWIEDEYFTPGWVEDEYFTPGTYYDSYCGCYSYGSSYGGGYSFGGGGYGGGFSMPRSVSYGYPSNPVSVSSPRYPSTPSSSSHSSSVSNTNVTNTSITNIDNSINDSFNNYNSNNVVIAQLAPATPQYPIVYTQPAPYCSIYKAEASGYGVNSVYLSWNSTNATSAYLSNVGSVSVNGSQNVYPTTSMTYVLTVYGANGASAQCQTTVSAYSAPYVSLTQIPYTGFDFGTLGNAMYWAGLIIFAMGSAYLLIYYVPAIAGARSERKFAPVVAAKAPILVEKEAALAPIISSIRTAVTDTMAIVQSKDGSMPKIVINRG